MGAGVLLWAAFCVVDEIVRAEGSMISSSQATKLSRTLEGGILARACRGRGDHVEKGELLATVARHAVPVPRWMICASDQRL